MSAPQSPFACTLAWLTVVALLFAGVPARHQSLGLQEDHKRAPDTLELASGLVTVDIAHQQLSTSARLIKVWGPLAAMTSAHLVVPHATASKELRPLDLARARDRRPSLIGTVELRI